MSWKKLGGVLKKAALPVATGGLSLLINTKRGNPQMPEAPTMAGGDQAALDAQMKQQRDLTGQDFSSTQALYTQQQQQLQDLLNKYRQNAETSLTTGPEGEAMRQQYNNLGLLNSGAFNDALAQKFAQIQQNSDMSLMNQSLNTTDILNSINQQGFQTQSDLGQAGLQRQFGLEDQAYQSAMNNYLARIKAKNDRTNSFIGAGGSILGNLLGRR